VAEPAEAALAILGEAGFSPRVDQRFDDDVPVDTVISTDPEPLTQVKRGATVTVYVSLGVEMLPMPELLSLTAAEAAEAVLAEGFPEPTLSEDWSETVPEGGVISATVEGAPVMAGEPYDHRSVVEIVASRGREPVTIPELVGLPRDEAETSLEEAGLAAQFGQAEYSESVPEGAVIRQSPPAHVEGSPDNIQLYRGDTVTLVLSLGMPYVEVPDIFGKTPAQAEQILRDAGLVPDADYWFGGVLNTVRFQDPQAGEAVRRGSTVAFTVL
nr:PASTA domain-containing protein [Actinomycetales bacterium]